MTSARNWKQTKLGDLHTTQKGFAFKSLWYSDNGHPIVKVSDFTVDSIDTNSLTRIPYEIVEKYLRYELREGDVVVQTVGSWPSNPASVVGKCISVPRLADKSLLNQNAVRLDPNDRIVKRFLYYSLRSPMFCSYIVGTAQGAASQAAITLDAIRNYVLSLPPLPTQHKIASILSNYDELIENNTRRIKILEEMAQSIYREWFVNYRFPGHEKVKMVDSPLGIIPEGWEVKSLSETILVNPTVQVRKLGKKPYVPMSSLSNETMVISNIEDREGNSGSKFMNKDTLFARITPCLENGKTGFVRFLQNENDIALGSTEFIVFRARQLTPEYIYLLSRSDLLRDHAIKSMTGATGRQRVQVKCFDNFLLSVPDTNLLNKFTKNVRPSFELIFLLNEFVNILRKTRDLLLPRLISGEIDVTDLDIQVPDDETVS